MRRSVFVISVLAVVMCGPAYAQQYTYKDVYNSPIVGSGALVMFLVGTTVADAAGKVVSGTLAYHTTLKLGNGHWVLFGERTPVFFYPNGTVRIGTLSKQAEEMVKGRVKEHNTTLAIPGGQFALFRGGTAVTFFPDGTVASATLAEAKTLPAADGTPRLFPSGARVGFNRNGRVARLGQAADAGGSSPFDGVWHTTRQHKGCCSYSASEDIGFTTDASSVTSSSGSFMGKAHGTVTGQTLAMVWATGQATFVLGADGKSLSGSFSSKDGHHGSLRGSR